MPQKQQDGSWPFGFWSLKNVMKRAKFQKIQVLYIPFFLKKINVIKKETDLILIRTNINCLPILHFKIKAMSFLEKNEVLRLSYL